MTDSGKTEKYSQTADQPKAGIDFFFFSFSGVMMLLRETRTCATFCRF